MAYLCVFSIQHADLKPIFAHCDAELPNLWILDGQ